MRKRNLIFVTVLSIITLGIYDIYWAFSTRNELVQKGQSVPSPLIVLAPLLSLALVAVMQTLVHLANFSGGFNTTLNVLSVIIGILAFVAIIPAGIFWLWRYSQAVDKVTKGELTAEISMVIALVTSVVSLGFVWPIVVQYYYNKTSKA